MPVKNDWIGLVFDRIRLITSSSFCSAPDVQGPATTAVAPAVTVTPVPTPQCVGGWSHWINQDSPDVGDGDHEQMTSSELTSFCPGGTITKVDCQTVDGIEYFSSGEVLTCTTDGGLQCNNADNFPIPCSDYKIRYECTCPRKSLQILSSAAVLFFLLCLLVGWFLYLFNFPNFALTKHTAQAVTVSLRTI